MRRIGITQRVEVVPERGERRDCLDQRWTPLLESAGFLPVPLPSLVGDAEAYIAALELDGFILSGGNDLAQVDPGHAVHERDRLEAALLELCGREKVPVLGVCRGMQFMMVSYGGAVDRVGHHAGTRHAVTVDGQSLPAARSRRAVNSFHNYGIQPAGCPAALRPVAWAADGSIEAVVHQGLPQVGIMWHPERESPYDAEDVALLHFVFRSSGGA